MSGHRAGHDIARAAFTGALAIPDPGAGEAIHIEKMGVCEFESAGARTLPDPFGAGLRVTLRNLSSGTVTVTADTALNEGGDTVATFDADGELLDLISVGDGSGGFRWEILVNTGSVGLA